ncbi:hypothetical protein [Spirochaeta dissipatitropha]
MRIHIIHDTSGSMTILGKPVIVDMSTRAVALYSRICTDLTTCEVDVLEWNGSPKELPAIMYEHVVNYALVLTDGFYSRGGFSTILHSIREHGITCRVVLCGEDARRPREDWEYSAVDILNAFDDVLRAKNV